MTNKRWFLLCVLGLLVASTLYRAYGAEPMERLAALQTRHAAPAPPHPPARHPVATSLRAAPAEAAAAPPAAAPAPVAPPDLAEVVAQAAQDPHTTPPALVQFAADLAPGMAAALHTEANAQTFFSTLEDCALATRRPAPRTARALCLSNAAILSQTHPALQPRYAALASRLDPDIVRLAH